MRGSINAIVCFVFMMLTGCWISGKDGQTYRRSRLIRAEKTIITGRYYRGGDFPRHYLNLREKGLFDYQIFAFPFYKGYYTGTWTEKNDTIRLEFLNNHIPNNIYNTGMIDTIKQFIYLQQDSGIFKKKNARVFEILHK